MSVVCVMTPVVIAAWPAISSAVAAAAVSLGYAVAEGTAAGIARSSDRNVAPKTVTLDLPNSEAVTGRLGLDQRIRVTRDGVTITFARDARGKVSLCVTGEGHTEAALKTLGEEMGRRVVQQYVRQRLLDELRAGQFAVVEEEADQNRGIRLTVRRWED